MKHSIRMKLLGYHAEEGLPVLFGLLEDPQQGPLFNSAFLHTRLPISLETVMTCQCKNFGCQFHSLRSTKDAVHSIFYIALSKIDPNIVFTTFVSHAEGVSIIIEEGSLPVIKTMIFHPANGLSTSVDLETYLET